MDKGKALAREGKMEEARKNFQLALDTLKNSGLTFLDHPRLEQTYFIFLGEIQAEEFRAMIDPSQIKPPEPPEEETPLDEISDLNLYSIQVDPKLQELVTQDLLETRFDIPVVLNERVLKFLNFYQNRGRRIMEEGLRRSGKYLDLFRAEFEKEGVPLDLVYLCHVESLFNPRARSRAKAIGLWQFMKGTGQLYDLHADWWVDERSDVQKSTQAAARYLKSLYATFNDWHLALAAYNVGPARIERVVRRHGSLNYWQMTDRRLLPRETANYVPSILASLIIFRHPARYGFDVTPTEPLEFETVGVDCQVELRVIADELGVSVAELSDLNPELRWGITPGTTGYRLKVPIGRADEVTEALAQLPPSERIRFAHHRVKRGDTLGGIARKYHTSIDAIVQMNRLRSARRISINQDLVIPVAGWRGQAARAASSYAAKSPAAEVAAVSLPAAHVVRRGESLFVIAKRYGVSVDDLRRWNKLRRGQAIYPGQTLRLENAEQSVSATHPGGSR